MKLGIAIGGFQRHITSQTITFTTLGQSQFKRVAIQTRRKQKQNRTKQEQTKHGKRRPPK
jgi:hypothetical protein